MEKKQTVYFRFPAGSEGAESMKKLVEAITTYEDKAEELAMEMGVTEYYHDSTAEFGGIGLFSFGRKPKSSVFKQVDVISHKEGESKCQLDKLYQLNVNSEDLVMTEEETEKHLGLTNVLISSQHYTWLEIKHRLTISSAAQMCGYKLTGDKERDDEYITMQLGGKKFRIVTVLKSKSQQAIEWYKAVNRLPTLPPFTSNQYAGVPVEGRQPVYFFFNIAGDFFCKAPAYSSFPHETLTESAFTSIYEGLNTNRT